MATRSAQMGRLTTHVLATATGKPAVGMRIDFAVLDATAWQHLTTVHTNADGRTDAPLMMGDDMRSGEFELVFHVAAHFRGHIHDLPVPPFLDRVPLLRHRRYDGSLSRSILVYAMESFHLPWQLTL